MAASAPYIASQLQASASHIFSDFGTGASRYIVKLSAPYRHDKRLRWGVEGQGASWQEAFERMQADGQYRVPVPALKAAQKAIENAKKKRHKEEYEPSDFARLVASGDIRVTDVGSENTYGVDREGHRVFSKNYPHHNPKKGKRKNPAAGKWVPYSPADAEAWAADKSPDKKGSYRLTGTGSALVTVSPIKLHPHTSSTVSYLPGVHIGGRWLNMERAYSTMAAAKRNAAEQYRIQARYEGHKANPARSNPRKKPVRYTLVMEGFGPIGRETAKYNMSGEGYFTPNLAEYAGHLYTWNVAANRIGSGIGHAGVGPATAAAYAKRAENEANAALKDAGHFGNYVKVHVTKGNPRTKRAYKNQRKH